MAVFRSIISEPPGGGSWEEEALCREYDSSLWLLSENPEDKKLNKERFEQAEVICSKCPVFNECWQYATYTDKRVTMRAGAWPLEYKDPPRDRSICKNGHDLDAPGAKDDKDRCRECNRDRVRRYRARVAGKGGKV